MKVALVTDAIVAPSGSDRVLKSLKKIFPDTDIFTAIFNPSRYESGVFDNVKTSFIQRLPLKRFWYGHYSLVSPIAFEQFDFSDYDLVISLSAGSAKGVITPVDTKHISLIFTPPRTIWGERYKKLSFNAILGGIPTHYLRIWDIEASLRPDKLVVPSKFIQNKVQKIYNREAEVVYLGVDTEFWKPETPSSVNNREDFYLVVSRLINHKLNEIAVKACEKTGSKLIVVGEGPQMKKLRKLAGPHTLFTGYLSDESVRELMRSCKAFLFPGVEDFGLACVEAMACGSPVIAYNKGGVSETVEDGVSGVLYDNCSVDGMIEGIRRFKSTDFDSQKVRKIAEKYSEENFIQKFKKVIQDEDF